MKHKANNKVGRGNCHPSTAWKEGLEHGPDSGRFLSNTPQSQAGLLGTKPCVQYKKINQFQIQPV